MADALSYYNALLGKLFNNGTPLPLRGGLNFVGFTIAQSAQGYTITANPAGAASASNIGNDSSVTGATVKDALNSNLAAIAANTAAASANTTAIGAGGATGALAYNAAATGALTRTSHWFTDGTALYSDASGYIAQGATGGPTVASLGWLRSGTNTGWYGRRTATAGDLPLLRLIGDLLVVGGGTEGFTGLQLETTSGQVLLRVASGTTFASGTAGQDFKSLPVISATTINGARVCPPTQAALASGANVANMTAAANYFMAASTTATASTVVCGATGAATGACLSFYIQAQSHNVAIQDASGTALRTVVAGAKEIVDVHWDTSTTKYANPTWKNAQ
jgi:hypothetical protein